MFSPVKFEALETDQPTALGIFADKPNGTASAIMKMYRQGGDNARRADRVIDTLVAYSTKHSAETLPADDYRLFATGRYRLYRFLQRYDHSATSKVYRAIQRDRTGSQWGRIAWSRLHHNIKQLTGLSV